MCEVLTLFKTLVYDMYKKNKANENFENFKKIILEEYVETLENKRDEIKRFYFYEKQIPTMNEYINNEINDLKLFKKNELKHLDDSQLLKYTRLIDFTISYFSKINEIYNQKKCGDQIPSFLSDKEQYQLHKKYFLKDFEERENEIDQYKKQYFDKLDDYINLKTNKLI